MYQQQARAALGRATDWRTSSYSQGQNTCVEVSTAVAGWVGLRDSKHPHGGHLAIPTPQWHALLRTAEA